MDELCEDERAIELSSIAAIYPEIVIDPSAKFKASLELPVSPTVPLKVLFQRPKSSLPTPPTSLGPDDNDTVSQVDAQETAPLSLSHLPPLKLDIQLPDGYPSLASPHFSITTNPDWLPPYKVAEFLTDGKRLWEECGKDFVVFTYIDHLQQLAERAFDLCGDHEDTVIFSRDLKVALMDFNIKSKREKFEQEVFECGVCLEPKKGAVCHRMLLCSHVFCISCLQGFYNACIKEGNVDNVKCLAPGCGKDPVPEPQAEVMGYADPRSYKKKDRTLNPSELLQIPLDQEVVQRYVQLKRKRKLESDKTVVYCPRQWCQGAARSKRYPKRDGTVDEFELSDDEYDETRPSPFDPLAPEEQLPPMSQRLSICEDCSYAFCSVCKKGWHGELAFCYPRRTAELSAADKASEDYIKTYTAPCPTCEARCQKAMGCNHMICFKCNTHFCYLCSSWLFESNPYSHFNDPDGGCYMRLWELEEGDDSGPAPPDWDRAAAEMQDMDSGDDDNADDLERHRGNRAAPPPVPVPPGINANQQNGRRPDDAARAAAAEQHVQAQAIAEARGQQLNPPNTQPPRQMVGLQRFLQLVQNDQEDGWDSDEIYL
ncbi:hypothetical protein GX48_01134 [Paracoccidioides brasiliensis]|nr:hypothetical protein GX48_01134 [Paracoccidioides brasiliensis]